MASNHLLRKAAESGNLEKIRERVDAGDDLEGRHTGTGRTPLLEATIAGHPDAVRLLLEHGADRTASCTAVGHTALGWAAIQDHPEVARILLAHGADPNETAPNSFIGHTPLMIAASAGHTEVLRLLLDAGGDPALQNKRGDNALSLAREHSNEAAAAILLDAGATPPAPADPPTALPWPELSWEPEHLDGVGSPIPDDASPAAVVWSYILAIHAWEVAAGDAMRAARATGAHYDMAPALAAANTVRTVHCTAKERRYPRASISAVPSLTPEFILTEIAEPTASRRELHVRHPEPGEFVHQYEWIFVCLRKGGRWRIDSAKSRLTGTEKWRQEIL